MNKNTQFGHGFKRQIYRYLKKHFGDLGNINEQFIFEMIFGICKSGDIKISNIGRALDEKRSLKHTLKRLYNRLSSQDYSNMFSKYSYSRMSEDTIFALDFSDITKPYTKKMENLSTVRDGDKSTYDKDTAR